MTFPHCTTLLPPHQIKSSKKQTPMLHLHYHLGEQKQKLKSSRCLFLVLKKKNHWGSWCTCTLTKHHCRTKEVTLILLCSVTNTPADFTQNVMWWLPGKMPKSQFLTTMGQSKRKKHVGGTMRRFGFQDLAAAEDGHDIFHPFTYIISCFLWRRRRSKKTQMMGTWHKEC